MRLIADISKKIWIKEDQEESPRVLQLFIGVRDNGKLPVFFDKTKFGYSLNLNDEEIYSETLPPEGHEYVSTDQDFIDFSAIENLIPAKEYVVKVWIEHAGDKWENSYTVSLPMPQQPFPSWTYNEEFGRWVAPIPRPEGTKVYLWNEELQEWYIPE